MLGYDLKSVLDLSVKDIHPAEDLTNVIEAFEKQARRELSTAKDIPVQRKNGTVFFADINSTPVRFGDSSYLVGIFRDITERKQADERIKSSLKEKEILLHEIHHRVKNNMQIIASLLKLQLNRKEKQDVDVILKENMGRVYSMAAIHESLHQSDKLSEINFEAYLQKLTRMLSQTYTADSGKISFQIESARLGLPIDQANPLGLALNELISNSLKYAFPNDQKGTIKILSKIIDDSEVELIFEDDGVGTPEGFDWKNSNTLGLKLVRNLVENQLNGSIELDATECTKFTIQFNLEANYK